MNHENEDNRGLEAVFDAAQATYSAERQLISLMNRQRAEANAALADLFARLRKEAEVAKGASAHIRA